MSDQVSISDAKRPRIVFYLAMLLLAITVVLVTCLAVSSLMVRSQREDAKLWLHKNGGAVVSRSHAMQQGFESYCPDREIGWWRRLLGDETAGIVIMGRHATNAEKARISGLFPETQVLDHAGP